MYILFLSLNILKSNTPRLLFLLLHTFKMELEEIPAELVSDLHLH